MAFNLTIDTGNQINKVYSNLEDAKAVLGRALRIAKAKQKRYDGVQIFNYMSIDEVELLNDGSLDPINLDLVYVDGSSTGSIRKAERILA